MSFACKGFSSDLCLFELINKRLLADFVVELRNTLVGPVFPQCREDVTQRVGPGMTFRRLSSGFFFMVKKCTSLTDRRRGKGSLKDAVMRR